MIPVVLTDEAGQSRHHAPASVSIPLPRGAVRDERSLWIADPAGRPTLHQATVLERWPDNSLRWVLLDFRADVEPEHTVRYAVRTDAAPNPVAGGLKLTSTETGLSVDTGRCRITPREGGDGVVVELTTPGGLSRVPLPLPSLEIDGRSSDSPASKMTVVVRGPVRTEWAFTGRTAGGLRVETRVATFADQCIVRVQHTVINTADVPSFSKLARVSLGVPIAARSGAVGIGERTRAFATLVPTREARQLDTTSVLVDLAGEDTKLDGWARVVAPDLTVTAVVRDLWQQYPAGFRLGANRFDVDVVAAPDAPLRFGVGAAKTFEIWLAIDPTPSAGDPALQSRSLRRPLIAVADPAWVASTQALPQLLVPTDPDAREALTRIGTALDHYLARNAKETWDDGPPVRCEDRPNEHRRLGAYGVLNWGDWNFPHYRDESEGCDAWGNLEYDLPQVAGLLWAATGSPVAREQFIAAVRHYRDVDVIHAMPGHADWVGMNHPHKMSHFAVEAPNQIDLGHTWLEGLLTHYRLTGETRSLAAARGIADVLATRLDKAGNPRQFGWPLIALVAVANATGEARYLDAARGFATAAMARVEPTPAAGDWKVGILADGLAYFDAATHDPTVRRWLVQYADAWMKDRARYADPRFALPIGYLASMTGNAAYRTAALEVARQTKIGEWGKTFAVAGRTVMRLLSPLALPRTGASLPVITPTGKRPPPPPAQHEPGGARLSPPGPGAPPPPLVPGPPPPLRSR